MFAGNVGTTGPLTELHRRPGARVLGTIFASQARPTCRARGGGLQTESHIKTEAKPLRLQHPT